VKSLDIVFELRIEYMPEDQGDGYTVWRFYSLSNAIVVTQRLLQLRIERLKGEAWEFKHLARTLLEKCKKTLNLHHIKRTDPGEPIA
jgi:hypothetical protein